jgi:hypothetical protein
MLQWNIIYIQVNDRRVFVYFNTVGCWNHFFNTKPIIISMIANQLLLLDRNNLIINVKKYNKPSYDLGIS